MTKLLAAAVLLAPAAALAAPLESQSADAASAFAALSADFKPALQARAAQAAPAAPILQPALKPAPFTRAAAPGAVLARVALASQLDRNFYLLNYKLGARVLDLGAATDAGFKSFYLTFTDRAGTAIGPLGDLNRLRGDGVDVRVDAATVYNFKVKINIFSPVRGSTLQMTPVQGTSGPAQSAKTGAVLDAARSRAAVFSAGGNEYWLFYGRDVRPDGSGFAGTRSFLFVHEDGLSSKAWPLAESALKTGVPASVDLGGTPVWLTRGADGVLTVSDDR